MKNYPPMSLCFAAVFCAVSTLASSANAGWLDDIFKPAAYEQIVTPPPSDASQAPASPHVINAPVQHDQSILLHDETPQPVPQIIDETPVPEPYYGPPMQAHDGPVPGYGQPMPMYESYMPQPGPPHGHGTCCKQPKVSYRNHPILAMLMHQCKTGQAHQVVLEVPTGCCPAEVTVCVPVSCQSVPSMKKRHDLFGRCVYEYCWPGGTKVKIVKRHNGDLVVHSYEL